MRRPSSRGPVYLRLAAQGPGDRRARRPLRAGPRARARRRRRRGAASRSATWPRPPSRRRACSRRAASAAASCSSPSVRPAPTHDLVEALAGVAARDLGRVALRRRRARLADGRGRRRERPARRASCVQACAARRSARRAARSSCTSATASRRARSRPRRSITSPRTAAAAAALCMKPGDRIRSLQGPILVLGASGFVGANLARSAARAPRGRGRDDEPHAGLAARGSARRANVREFDAARRAERRPDARRGAAAHRLQLHRLRRVLVRDRRRTDPAHEPR